MNLKKYILKYFDLVDDNRPRFPVFPRQPMSYICACAVKCIVKTNKLII